MSFPEMKMFLKELERECAEIIELFRLSIKEKFENYKFHLMRKNYDRATHVRFYLHLFEYSFWVHTLPCDSCATLFIFTQVQFLSA